MAEKYWLIIADTPPMDDGPLALLIVGAIFVGVAVYMLPSIIAAKKKSKHSTSIALVNVFFGATVVGWVVALFWAMRDEGAASEKKCPFCAEQIKREAAVCRYCGNPQT